MAEYEVDHAAWASEQGALLRAREFDGLDHARLADELERLGRADFEELRERIRALVTALLRWAYEAEVRSVALHSTIGAQRERIARILEDGPSLRPIAAELVIETYPVAKRAAVVESGLFEESFPEGLPFLPDEVIDRAFLPDPYGDDQVRGNYWWRNR